MSYSLLDRDLHYLTDVEAGGRLSGTAAADRVALWLSTRLEGLGIAPGGKTGYLQPLKVEANRLLGPARLSLGDLAPLHRRDFAEMGIWSRGAEFRAPLTVFREDEEVEDPRGKAVLLPEPPRGFDPGGSAQALAEAGALALLYAAGEPEWFSKSLFGRADSRIPVLRLRSGLARTMASLGTEPLHLSLPLEFGARDSSNVLGLIPGSGEGPALLLAAHYDHVGDDPEGPRFPGAEDNASGVAVLLAVAERLLREGKALPFDILLAFLTGEESGLFGARALLKAPPRPIGAAVNIDGLGVEGELAALRLGHAKRGDCLAEFAAPIIEARGHLPLWIEGRDDSSLFRSAGISTLGLGQESRGPRLRSIHSPTDRLETLGITAIEATVDLVLELVEAMRFEHKSLFKNEIPTFQLSL